MNYFLYSRVWLETYFDANYPPPSRGRCCRSHTKLRSHSLPDWRINNYHDDIHTSVCILHETEKMPAVPKDFARRDNHCCHGHWGMCDILSDCSIEKCILILHEQSIILKLFSVFFTVFILTILRSSKKLSLTTSSVKNATSETSCSGTVKCK